MDHEERNSMNKGYSRFRSTLHLVMGTFYIMMAFMLFYIKRFGAIDLSGGVAYTLSVFFCLYGVFRIWRGWADMKALNNERKR